MNINPPTTTVWLASNAITPGYYWRRYGEADSSPMIVKIDDQQSPDELALWEVGRDEWESLHAYGAPWQFLPVPDPTTPAVSGLRQAMIFQARRLIEQIPDQNAGKAAALREP